MSYLIVVFYVQLNYLLNYFTVNVLLQLVGFFNVYENITHNLLDHLYYYNKYIS